MNKAYLCLGANLGDCLATFARAEAQLRTHGITINSKSSVYVSRAWGMQEAPDFFNQVFQVSTALSARELLGLLLQVEKQLGRDRKPEEGYSSRTIDIDILFFNEAIIEQEGLHVPHPRLHLRKFVLEPMREIAPDLMHPVLKKTIHQLLRACTDTHEARRITHAL